MENNITVWEYNGQTFNFDLFDAETAQRYEKVVAQMERDKNNIKRTGKASDLIRANFKLFTRAFDSLLGEGSGEKIIGTKQNLRIAMEAWTSFIGFCYEQKEDLNKIKNLDFFKK